MSTVNRLADLHRQGFMKRAFASKKPKKVRIKGPTVECFACMNWHEKNRHTKTLTAAEKRRAVQIPIADVAGVKGAIDLRPFAPTCDSTRPSARSASRRRG